VTKKERILRVLKGEIVDKIPYTPRIDLWYNANQLKGTLPEKYKNFSMDDISRLEGWALHKVSPDFIRVRSDDDILHRAIGLFSLKEMVFQYQFSKNIDIHIEKNHETTTVAYTTPVGYIRTKTILTDEMKQSGVSLPYISEHAIKEVSDFNVMRYIFHNISLLPSYNDYQKWQEDVGDDGVAVTMGGLAASPMHHIQRDLLDPTAFYFRYNDNYKEMRSLAESLNEYYDQALKIIAKSSAEVVLFGANYDDMITYKSYFDKELMPWIKKMSVTLENNNKLLLCHCDGENKGLIDSIYNSGMHVAEALCPFPMTKMSLSEYYDKWKDKVTIWGGIPSTILLRDSASKEEFRDYIKSIFDTVAPEKRFILSVADCVPPGADFDRLIEISEYVEKEGHIPTGRTRIKLPIASQGEFIPSERLRVLKDRDFSLIGNYLIAGKEIEFIDEIKKAVESGCAADMILKSEMLPAMEYIGQKFKNNEIYIPEVLLVARAMNSGVKILEPFLTSKVKGGAGTIIIGTVKGDLHDIGKNIITTMLKGVGFNVVDLGVNIASERFVEMVAEIKPNILGLSALLTTTMHEMKSVINVLEKFGLRKSLKIMVGGAPINQKFANDIGADGYARDAGEAIDLAKQLVRDSPLILGF
jgi:methylmalonyl-CoA mutase cobalamin-binding domain/chain